MSYNVLKNINKDSVIVEIGRFRGKPSKRMVRKYGCKLIVYEASRSNFKRLKKETSGTDIVLHNKAVVGSDDLKKMKFYEYYRKPGSASIYNRTGETKKRKRKLRVISHTYKVECTNISCIFKENGLDSIDLLTMNCEGSEISIIKHILSMPECLKKIRNICFQTHRQIYGRKKIKSLLASAELNYQIEVKRSCVIMQPRVLLNE